MSSISTPTENQTITKSVQAEKNIYEAFDDDGDELPPCEPPSTFFVALLSRREEEGWGVFKTDDNFERASLDHLEPKVSQLFTS